MKKLTLIILLLAAFVVYAFPLAAGATTYYVSPLGCDHNPGTKRRPFRNIQRAVDYVGPGDKVIVASGIYKDLAKKGYLVMIRHSGTADKWITFKSEVKWGAILDGQMNTTDYGWSFYNANHIKVEGFQLKGFVYGGFWLNSDDHDIVLENNLIYEIGRRIVPKGADGGSGIFIGREPRRIVVSGNVLHTIGRLRIGIDRDFNQDHGIYVRGEDIEISHNLFYDFRAGWPIHIYGGSGNGVYIYNNTFADANPGRRGQIIVWYRQKNVVIENNIFYRPNTCGINLNNGSNVIIRNNLSSSGTVVVCPGSSGNYIIQNNLSGLDPMFVNPSIRDYHLLAGSPAIGRGLPFGHNYIENHRLTSLDLGAYGINKNSKAQKNVNGLNKELQIH